MRKQNQFPKQKDRKRTLLTKVLVASSQIMLVDRRQILAQVLELLIQWYLGQPSLIYDQARRKWWNQTSVTSNWNEILIQSLPWLREPRTGARFDTYLLIVAINRVSRRIVLFCLLNDENVMSEPKPIPILLKICDVALTQTWMSFSFDQSPFPFRPRKYSIPSIAPVNVHPRINNAVSMTYGKIAVNQTIFPIDFVPRNTKKYIKTHVSISKPKSSHLILPN